MFATGRAPPLNNARQVHGGDATEPNDVCQDDGISRGRRFRIPSQPVQDGNPETGTAENPEISDECEGGILWDGLDTHLPRDKHEPDPKDGRYMAEAVSTVLSFMR